MLINGQLHNRPFLQCCMVPYNHIPIAHVDFRADPLVPVRMSFFAAVLGIFHVKAAVSGTGGVAVNVVSDFRKSAFIPLVIRDQCFGKVEFIFKEAVSFNCIKSGIPKESIRAENQMQGKEIREYRS